MRWLQKNQAHLLVVERARQENSAKRLRLPEKTLVLVGLLVAWFGLWVLSVLYVSARSWLLGPPELFTDNNNHEHEDIKLRSPLLRGLKRHRVGSCYFRSQEQPQFGFITSPCSLKRDCAFRETLLEARDACLNVDHCAGITFVPWEERYELRDGSAVVESFDGQQSSLKLCDDDEAEGATETSSRDLPVIVN